MSPTPTASLRQTGPNGSRSTANYGTVLQVIRDHGLLERRLGFYLALTTGLVLALSAALSGLILSGDTWLQLLVAISLAVILTQFAFLGHEASHRQVFESKRANDRFGRMIASLVVGISYSWWMNKHTRHHANPNRVGHDPDISSDVIVFQPTDAQGKGKLYTWFIKHQGTLFFPMLLLEGVNLHVQGIRYLLDRRNQVDGRAVELAMLTMRLIALPVLAFLSLSPWVAFAFLLVHVGLFGVYMGASFAPNHKGMPHVPAELKLSFFHKQVLTSRNITGRGMTALFGGLNYQIEHHLFPNMPRPHLAKAAAIVRDHCARLNVTYTAVSIGSSYRTVIAHLNSVGTADRDLFECPVAAIYGRR